MLLSERSPVCLMQAEGARGCQAAGILLYTETFHTYSPITPLRGSTTSSAVLQSQRCVSRFSSHCSFFTGDTSRLDVVAPIWVFYSFFSCNIFDHIFPLSQLLSDTPHLLIQSTLCSFSFLNRKSHKNESQKQTKSSKTKYVIVAC